MAENSLVLGSTYNFKLTAKKDGVVWNITSATVNLYLKKPTGTILTKTATVTSGSSGIAEFTCSTSDLDTAGIWSRSWKVTEGSTVQESAPILFVVVDSP